MALHQDSLDVDDADDDGRYILAPSIF